jgi:hypothetical protein
MYFRNLITGCCILSALFGCAKRDAPATQPIEVKLEGGGDCLTNIDAQVTKFTDGKSSPAEVRAFWTCLSASVQKFQDITSGGGAAGDQYSSAALRQFIQHYFYKTKLIPDSVLDGLMQIKRVLLAGSDKQVSRVELVRLQSLFNVLSEVSLEIQPNIRILLRKDKNASDAQVRAAAASLQQAMKRIGGWLATENQTLEFQKISSAINALADWTQVGGKDTSAMHTLRQAALILPEGKSILIGGSKTAITGDDWPYLCDALNKGLYLYLAAANGFDQNLDAALNRAIVPESASGAIDALAQSTLRHPGGEISLQEFKNLYAKLDQTDWMPAAITSKGLEPVTEWLLTRLLGDGVTPATGLNTAQVAKLHTITDNWQMLINSAPQDTAPLVQAFGTMLVASKPITWDAQGRMIFPDQMPAAWTADGRRHMIWPYVVLRFVKDAYAGANVNSLNEAQMTTAATEILPLLQNFGWLMSTKTSIGRRILREADLFTLAGNGDGVIDMNEATRYLAFVVASYRSAQVWLDTAAAGCKDNQADCVRAQAFTPGSAILSNMPRLQKVMAGWTPQQFVAYMENAETTILGAPEAAKFTTGDLLQTYQLFEYVEVFVELYDGDHNDVIGLTEAQAAYKVYGPTLGRLLPQSDEGFFTFMFKYGDTPFTMWGGQELYIHWQQPDANWTLGADRKILMGILSQLSKFASQ